MGTASPFSTTCFAMSAMASSNFTSFDEVIDWRAWFVRSKACWQKVAVSNRSYPAVGASSFRDLEALY